MSDQRILDAQRAILEFGQIVAEQMQTLKTLIIPVMVQLYDGIYSEYLKAGAIYGESHSGLLQWLADLGEINRHQQIIEEIKLRHWVIASTKQMLLDKKNLTPNE